MSMRRPAYPTRNRLGSGSALTAIEAGRSGNGIGSSSPTRATSYAFLRSSFLPPTDVKTVARLTPAASAMVSIDVAT